MHLFDAPAEKTENLLLPEVHLFAPGVQVAVEAELDVAAGSAEIELLEVIEKFVLESGEL